jgi:hypothetical protein
MAIYASAVISNNGWTTDAGSSTNSAIITALQSGNPLRYVVGEGLTDGILHIQMANTGQNATIRFRSSSSGLVATCTVELLLDSTSVDSFTISSGSTSWTTTTRNTGRWNNVKFTPTLNVIHIDYIYSDEITSPTTEPTRRTMTGVGT